MASSRVALVSTTYKQCSAQRIPVALPALPVRLTMTPFIGCQSTRYTPYQAKCNSIDSGGGGGPKCACHVSATTIRLATCTAFGNWTTAQLLQEGRCAVAHPVSTSAVLLPLLQAVLCVALVATCLAGAEARIAFPGERCDACGGTVQHMLKLLQPTTPPVPD